MGPGIVALLLVMLCLFLTSVSIVREKEQQTMDALLSSNLNTLEIFLGKAGPMAILGIAQMCLGILVVGFWFKIPIRGNILYLFIAAVIFLAAILSFALLISTISATQQQALFFAWFSSLLFILLAGLFTPVENIPAGFKFLADINPVRYLIEIIREIYLKGNGIEHFIGQLSALALIAVVVTSISLINFKRFVSK
jgi:ABC-2 type transport system permease protein